MIGLGLLAGAGVAASTATPINTAVPEISGSAAPGQTLTGTTGLWSNDPTSFAFQWLRCPQSGGQGDGSDCGQIAGATTSTYTLVGDDVGFTIRVRVTATNADGSASAASNPSSIVQAAAAAPVSTAEPQISGSAVQGQTLTATTGSWSNNPTSFAFQWLRCPQSGGQGDGSDCALIAGATANSYALAAADVGFTIRVRVTATNADGSASAASNPSSIVQAAAGAPVSTTAPQISGSAVQGQTLTATTGSWSNNPTSFAFQWLRCPQSGGQGDGSDCALIVGATANSYALAVADVGFRIRVRVTASTAAGSASAVSNPTGIVTGVSGPSNTVPPTVSGTPIVGRVLTLTRGTWTGTQPIGYQYQWLRCDRNGGACTSITGAVGLTWRVLAASVGHTIRARVTAKNPGGTTQATSVPTAIVPATTAPPLPPSAAGCPAGSGPVSVSNVHSPARLQIDRQLSPSVVNRRTRQMIVRYHVSACGGRSVKGALVYATAVPFNQLSIPPERATGGDGWTTLDFRMLAGFPVSAKQQLIAIFTRARKSGENPLGGISSRRLFSVQVNLHG